MNAYYLILYGTPFLILYAYRPLHIVSKTWSNEWKLMTRILFLLVAVFVYASTSYLAVHRDEFRENQFLMDYTIIGAVTLSVTLFAMTFFQLIADLVLLGRFIRYKATTPRSTGNQMKRRTFLNRIALAAGGIMVGSFIWGTTKGKYRWRIINNYLSFDNLPASFDGLRIVQISDFHLGSFHENFEPIKEAIQLVNELNPDYIFFTGDLVNEDPSEAEPWIPIFRQLKARYGKYSILGNHDYGWGSDVTEREKDKNSAGVHEMNQLMGFKVMMNEHQILEKDGDKIGLIGVENWGFSEQNWFPTRGDYQKSVKGMEDVPFKILLSHDPTHWDHHILNKEDVDLTLAGHTHGGQMGISIPGLKEFSVGKLFYKRYAGLYSENKQHLYVNRGMGFLIFPGRVGMPPEITLHVLNKA